MRNFLRYHWPVLFFLSAAILATVFSVDYQQSLRAQISVSLGLFCYVTITIFTNTPSRMYSVLFASSFSIFLATLFILPDEIMSQPDNPLLQIIRLGNALFVVPNDVLILAVMAPLMLSLAWVGDWRLRGLTIRMPAGRARPRQSGRGSGSRHVCQKNYSARKRSTRSGRSFSVKPSSRGLCRCGE